MNMKKVSKYVLISSLILAIFVPLVDVSTADASVRVKGYYKSSTGTYVSPSYRSSPNRSKLDNYSSKGNYNPYSGKSGTRTYRY